MKYTWEQTLQSGQGLFHSGFTLRLFPIYSSLEEFMMYVLQLLIDLGFGSPTEMISDQKPQKPFPNAMRSRSDCALFRS